MANTERPEEIAAREVVEAALGVSLTHADLHGEVDYIFTTNDERSAALEVTTVTSAETKVSKSRWSNESPKYSSAQTLDACWEVVIEDVNVNYRGLTDRLEPHVRVLEQHGLELDAGRLHEFIGGLAVLQSAASELVAEAVSVARPIPFLCAAEPAAHDHRIVVIRASGWSASGSDASLLLIEQDLNSRPDNARKLKASGAKDLHLFVWLDPETPLEISRPFRGGSPTSWEHFRLPSRPPSLLDPVDMLWIVDRVSNSGWIWNGSNWTTYTDSRPPG